MKKYFNFFNKEKPIFIAELSSNHNGSLENAKKLIMQAKKFGADIVKFQTYTPENITLKSMKKDFLITSGTWKGFYLWDLYNDAQTPMNWHKELFDFSKKNKIICFSSPFDEASVDFLETLNCPFYKLASFEITHIPLIKKMAKTKKDIIISTGMASISEIDLAYQTAIKNGARRVILLYCVSNYPAKETDFNFNNIRILKERYKCKVGFSDHSTDNKIAKAAILAGAEIIEKHIALENVKSPDYSFSLKGKEIKKFVNDIHESYNFLGKKFFFRNKSEKFYKKFRRSIYASTDIKKGEKFNSKNIKVIRPGFGLNPGYYEKIINKKSPYNIKSQTPLRIFLLKRLKISI